MTDIEGGDCREPAGTSPATTAARTIAIAAAATSANPRSPTALRFRRFGRGSCRRLACRSRGSADGRRCGRRSRRRSAGTLRLFGQHPGEVAAPREAVVGILGESSSQHGVDCGQFRSCVGQEWRRHVEVAADDDGGIGVREQLRTGQQVVGGGREGVLVGAPVDVVAGELFGGSVRDGSLR